MNNKVEVEIEGNLLVMIDIQNEEAHVIKSLQPTNNVIIPRYAKYKRKKYQINFIEGYAFRDQHIESIEFPKNSEVLAFEDNCFYGTHLRQLQIPSSLVGLKDNWCSNLYDLTEIEVPKKNIYFLYLDQKFLIGKKTFKDQIYTNLHYARFDVMDADIPPFIEIMKRYSFHNHPYVRSITFPENSELTTIQDYVIHSIPIQLLILPPKLVVICKENFINTPNLVDIRVSMNNSVYQVLDDRCLYRKSDTNNSIFNVLQLAPRDIQKVEIQSFVTTISSYAFYQCNRIQSISFDSDSTLEVILDYAFAYSTLPKEVVFPESVKDLRIGCFSGIMTVSSFTFLAKSIKIANFSFQNCANLEFISFPGATEIIIDDQAFDYIPQNAKIFVNKNAKMARNARYTYKEKIIFIE